MYTRFNVPTVGVHHARPRIEGARARVRRENQPAISLRALFSSPLSPWRTKFSLIASRLLVRFDGHPIFPSHFRIERNKMEWNYTSISLSLEFNYSIRNFWSNCNIILFDDTFSNIYIYVKCLNLTSTLSKYVSTSLSDSRSSVPTINPLTPRAHIPSHHPSHPSKSPVRTYITTPVCGTTYGQL